MAAAYRELAEETAITQADVELRHLMDFTYHLHQCYVEVYAGVLNREVTIAGEENELYWSELNRPFFDMTQYAGEGNIGHMIEQVKLSRHLFLK